jgi:hypothetical protein
VHTARTVHKPHPNRPANPAEKKGPEKPTNPEPSGSNRDNPMFPARASDLSRERYTALSNQPVPAQPKKKNPQKTNNPEESGSNRERPFLPRGPRRSLGSSRFASFRRSPPFLRINPNPTPILPFLISNNFNRWQEIPTLKPGDLISGPGCIRRSRHRWPRTLAKGYRTGVQNEEGSLHALRLAARLELHMRVSHCPQPPSPPSRACARANAVIPCLPTQTHPSDQWRLALSVHPSFAIKFPPPESSLELRSADPDARSTRSHG